MSVLTSRWQVKQLVEVIKKSEADFVILGGDFNADPVVNKEETTLKDINNLMVSSIEEISQKIKVKHSTLDVGHHLMLFLGLADTTEGHIRKPLQHLQL